MDANYFPRKTRKDTEKLGLIGFVFSSVFSFLLSVTSCGEIAYSDFAGFEIGFVLRFFSPPITRIPQIIDREVLVTDDW
ncbi:MAG: hypothetical protein ACYSOW_08735 [Planctomycetota bacterium]|jgi:hypothetical protein